MNKKVKLKTARNPFFLSLTLFFGALKQLNKRREALRFSLLIVFAERSALSGVVIPGFLKE